ncbi:MAG: hypothetical protein ACI8ZX_001474 [Planctomycetota bacterium]|jgi:hypothetical protein
MTYNQAIKKFNYSGRKTLRTVLDYLSHEWNDTLLEQKSDILSDLITENYSLTYFLEQYINFYAKELYNKEYVILAIPKSLEIIYSKSTDEDFQNLLIKQYLDFMLQSNLCLEYKIEIPAFIKKEFPFEEYFLNTEEETFEDVIFMSSYNYLALYKSIALQKEEYLLVKKIEEEKDEFLAKSQGCKEKIVIKNK